VNVEPWLRLWRVPKIGPAAFHKLLSRFGSPDAAFEAGIAGWREAGLTAAQVDALDTHRTPGIDADLAWLEAAGNDLILWGSDRYPERLANIPTPPPLLFTRGDTTLLDHPQLAIVGSRHPSQGGRNNATAFARHLAAAGLGITSGLALGIDAAAHEGALQAEGVTVAVTGTGLDRIYPARNRALAHRIADNGLLVSEFPVGVGAQAANFPRRNRIISGLSMGCLVVEAARRSGSLITARYSLEQGREVYAIPGSIHSPLARGCHQLIREGAKLVETAMDIIEELPPPVLDAQDVSVSPEEDPDIGISDDLSEQEAELMNALGHDPATIDMLVQRTGWSVEQVSGILMDLHLRSRLNVLPGSVYMRTYP